MSVSKLLSTSRLLVFAGLPTMGALATWWIMSAPPHPSGPTPLVRAGQPSPPVAGPSPAPIGVVPLFPTADPPTNLAASAIESGDARRWPPDRHSRRRSRSLALPKCAPCESVNMRMPSPDIGRTRWMHPGRVVRPKRYKRIDWRCGQGRLFRRPHRLPQRILCRGDRMAQLRSGAEPMGCRCQQDLPRTVQRTSHAQRARRHPSALRNDRLFSMQTGKPRPGELTPGRESASIDGAPSNRLVHCPHETGEEHMKTIERNRMKRVLWIGVVASIVILSAGAYAATNVPVARRITAVGTCQVYSGTPYVNSAYQIQNDLLTASVICPVVSDTTAPTGSVIGLTVSGWSATINGVQATACVIFAGGYGGDCGPPSGTVAGTVSVPVQDKSKWTAYPGDYPYVRVDLGTGSNVWGLTYTSTFVIP